jgi:hypothetical protein
VLPQSRVRGAICIAEREREVIEALRSVGDKVSRVLRPVANGDKWFAQ